MQNTSEAQQALPVIQGYPVTGNFRLDVRLPSPRTSETMQIDFDALPAECMPSASDLLPEHFEFVYLDEFLMNLPAIPKEKNVVFDSIYKLLEEATYKYRRMTLPYRIKLITITLRYMTDNLFPFIMNCGSTYAPTQAYYFLAKMIGEKAQALGRLLKGALFSELRTYCKLLEQKCAGFIGYVIMLRDTNVDGQNALHIHDYCMQFLPK
jgi:hypothetical protein